MPNKERYIDADLLVEKLKRIYVGMPNISVPYNSAGSGSLEAAVINLINGPVVHCVNSALLHLQHELARIIEESATLEGTPCFLCKQRDCDELPAKVHI